MKIHLVEGLGSADHDPVVAKKQAPKRGDKCDGPNVAEAEIGVSGWVRQGYKRGSMHAYRTALPSDLPSCTRRSDAPAWLPSSFNTS